MKKLLLICAITVGLWGCQKDKIAGFNATPFQPYALLPATFTAHSTSGTNYSWEFGDNTTATGQKVTHTFQIQGMFVVKLTVDGISTEQIVTVQ